MTGEGDAIGQLADATLIGAALEHGGAAQGHDDKCGNCGNLLTGAYCQICGQRGHIHRSLLHLIEELFHGVLHLDGKIWRTAPLLLFRPGALTKRYVEGQRVRFISPVGLFLFSVFLMFFAVASLDDGEPGQRVAMSPQDRAQLQHDLSQVQAELDKSSGGEAALGKAKAAMEAARQAVEAKPAEAETAKEEDVFSKPLGLDWRSLARKIAKSKHLSVGWGGPETEKRVRASLADPDLLLYKLRGAASEYSFMLVPASVPFLWLVFFWRRRVFLFDHVIFALHSLSFMALFVAAAMMALKFDLGWLWGPGLFLVPPLHMFFHLKGAYGLGFFGALWRTCFLSVAAIIVLSCYASAILVLGLIH